MEYPDPMVCTKCGIPQPLRHFLQFTKDGKPYRKHACRACAQKANREWLRINAERHRERARQRKQKYRLTDAIIQGLIQRQSGLCGVCKCKIAMNDRYTHIDHDHKTGQVRGILCHKCNLALGLLKEDPMRVYAAYRYLKQHPPNLVLFTNDAVEAL